MRFLKRVREEKKINEKHSSKFPFHLKRELAHFCDCICGEKGKVEMYHKKRKRSTRVYGGKKESTKNKISII